MPFPGRQRGVIQHLIRRGPGSRQRDPSTRSTTAFIIFKSLHLFFPTNAKESDGKWTTNERTDERTDERTTDGRHADLGRTDGWTLWLFSSAGLRRLSVGEFADVDILRNLITTLAEREIASQSTETTTTATTTTATATTTTTSAAGSAESSVDAGHDGDVESEGESHEDSVGRRGTGLQTPETDRRLEHLAILADMSLTEGIVDNLAGKI